MAYKAYTYWNQLLEKHPDAQGVCYPNWPLSYNKLLHRQQLQGLKSLLSEYQIQLEEKKILEVGPGSGFWTSFFHEQKPASYRALEISEKAASVLQNQFKNATILHGSISDELPTGISKHKYDVIFIAMVLLHITDEALFQKAISNIASVLAPNGSIIILDSPLVHNAYKWQRSQVEGPEFDNSFHNKIRTLDTWKKQFDTNNMYIEKIVPAFNISQMCFDFKSYSSYVIFGKILYAIHRRILENCGETLGLIYGKLTIASDFVLTKLLGQSMSAKWMLIKKVKPNEIRTV